MMGQEGAGRDSIESGQSRRFRVPVQGVSMSPLIESGDSVLAVDDPELRITKGSIVVFRGKHGLIVHRVIAISGSIFNCRYCQKGDNGRAFSWILEETILGSVRSVEKNGRVFSLRSPNAIRLGRWIASLGFILMKTDLGAEQLPSTRRNPPPASWNRPIGRLAAGLIRRITRLSNRLFLWLGN